MKFPTDSFVRSACSLLLTFVTLSAVQADTIKLSGHISTTVKFETKYFVKVPDGVRTLVISIPIPSAKSAFGFSQSVQGIEVSASRQPVTCTNQSDQSGNTYCIEKYSYPVSGTIEFDVSTEAVTLQTDLMQPFPESEISSITGPSAVMDYLKPSPKAQSADPAIIDRAKTFLVGGDDEAVVIANIQRWLQQEVIYDGKPPPGEDDAVSILHNRTSVYDGWSNLFIALARADGIPARFVSGYYVQGQMAFPTDTDGYTIMTLHSRNEPHSWVEVWFPSIGWVPCDPQISSGFIDTHHVALWSATDSGSGVRFATWTSIGHPSSAVAISETESSDLETGTTNLTCIASTPEAALMSLLSRCQVGDQLPAPIPHP